MRVLPLARRAITASKASIPLRPPFSTFVPRLAAPESPAEKSKAPTSVEAVSNALRDAKAEDNNLLSPIHCPEDPNAILNSSHPATPILANSSVVVQRQLEMMNVMLGWEQANRYVIMDPNGNHLGYMAEQEFGMGNAMARQYFRTHRSFTTHVFDRNMKEVLRVRIGNTKFHLILGANPCSSTDRSHTSPLVSKFTILWKSPRNLSPRREPFKIKHPALSLMISAISPVRFPTCISQICALSEKPVKYGVPSDATTNSSSIRPMIYPPL
jgi:hypothetical protein